MARSESVKSDGRTYDEQYSWLRERTDPASAFERSFLDYLYERKRRLPDFAQDTPVADVFVQPDFYYQRGTIPGVCVFIDGPHHASRTAEDGSAREALEDRGFRIVAIAADRPLAEQIEAFPDIFVAVANGE
jgi:very-short-patch-repair endonuclease